MKKILLLIGLALVAVGAIYWYMSNQGSKTEPTLADEVRAELNVMPLPLNTVSGEGAFLIESGLSYKLTSTDSEQLQTILSNFGRDLFKSSGVQMSSNGADILINCKANGVPYPVLDMDETYNLSITKDQIEITANTRFGVDHALQTLLQLVGKNGNTAAIPAFEIYDKPSYQWRGLMMDISRHWIPASVIMENIDMMNRVKLNVLHLHLSDNQGFRIESKRYPKLHELGSDGEFLTQDNVLAIIEYAAALGIRVIPEFDLPGHSSPFFIGYPELGSTEKDYRLMKVGEMVTDILDVTKESTYQFLDGFFEEMSTLFPDQYMHIGGDEVSVEQWLTNEDLMQRKQDLKINTTDGLTTYFMLRCQKILKKYGKRMVGWDEITHPQLESNHVVIQSWRDQSTLFNAARMNHPAILSTGWYLDHKLHADQLYSVDPTYDPNAITVDPDTNNWEIWNIQADIRGNIQPGKLFLFGEKSNSNGVLILMQRTSVFQSGVWVDNNLNFEYESSFGRIEGDFKFDDSKLTGSIGISILDFEVLGEKVGANNMTGGEKLPKFSQGKALTEDQKNLILGGEACQWAEVVDQNTVNSRIWPNTAVVAEKLWSSVDHTQNVEDMYRRLRWFDENHAKEIYGDRRVDLISDIGQGKNIAALTTFIDHLEEVKYFERFPFVDMGGDEIVMNYVADAARPESFPAREITALVDMIVVHEKEQDINSLILHVDELIPIYRKLVDQFDTNNRIKETEFLSLVLSDLSKIAKAMMQGEMLTEAELTYYARIKVEAIKPRDGVVLQTAFPLIKLIDYYLGK